MVSLVKVLVLLTLLFGAAEAGTRWSIGSTSWCIGDSCIDGNGTPDLRLELSSGITALRFPTIPFSGGVSNCTGQTASIGCLNATNNGTAAGTLQCKVAANKTGITLALDISSAFSTEKNLTTSYSDIASISTGASQYVWARRHYTPSYVGGNHLLQCQIA